MHCNRGCRPALAVPVLALVAISCLFHIVSAHEHAGCGQHSPIAQQQQRVLRRRLQQLRANNAADKQQQPAASSSSGSSGAVSPQELRIAPVYDLSGVGPRDAQRIEQQLVPAAIKVLQKYIKVLRPAGPPVVRKAFYSDSQQGSCIISKNSAELAAAGKSNDLALYITSQGTGCLSGMIAVASACEVDPDTKRPILGSLNVCPSALTGLDGLNPDSEAYGYAMGRLVEVLVHEIIHVLGFGSNHYEDWRGPDGRVYGLKRVIVNEGGRPYLATPKVTKVAREYFGCPSLPGAPLENEGPSFSAISHFEYRLLQREMMSPARPIDRSRARLSAFTLAALEDSGWYAANYDDVEPLDWGRGAGCDFVLSSCWDYINKVPGQPYFCGKGSVNQTRCTAAASGWGVCRSSAFTDQCLLVGKYSTDTSAAVREDVAASGADGRAAACYSPPQLEALQKDSSKGNLLPLLGGSFSAQPGDICYNLIAQPKPSGSSSSGSSKPGCTIPEDCVPGAAAKAQVAKQAERVTQESGAGQSRRPLAALETLEKAPVVFTFFEQDVKQGGVRSISGDNMDNGRTAACVNLAEGPAATAAAGAKPGGGSGAGSSSSTTPRRALLTLLSGASHVLTAAFSHIPHTISSSSSGASRSLQAATAADVTSVLSAAQAPSATAAACTSSPVLCFRSSCDSSGQLTIEAHLPAGSSSSSTVKFACPSGQTVDLVKALAGRYLLGVLQCPSNQLVCETTGCGDCSLSGGSCHRGKCYCHMERYGPGCKQTLVPKL